MAAGNAPQGNLQKLDWFLSHKQHDVWDRFTADQQARMVDEDLQAGFNVSLVLVALIAAGMLLSVITVLTVLATS